MPSPWPELSIIIPAYNETKRIKQSIEKVVAYLRARSLSWELWIVDDGSRDNTAELVMQAIDGLPEAQLISYKPNRGKGFAVRAGVLAARGQWVAFLDADLSTPPEEIDGALEFLRSGNDMVIGSRALRGSKIVRKPPLYRRLATAAFNQIKYALVGLRQFSDTQCGFKAYRRSSVRPLYERSIIDRFMFDVEILYLAQLKRLKVREMPVSWAASEDTKVRLIEGVVNMIRDLVRIRWAHREFKRAERQRERIVPLKG
jgi:dolichyl-phosphate beta-glucosyltransferase